MPTYETIIKAAVAIGNDTDTTACVAGGIAGIRHGVAGIPARWHEAFRGRALVEPLLAQLVARG
jgi:ADP-ribosylglycohydrolase